MSVVIIKFCFYLKRKRKQHDTKIKIQIPGNMWLFVFLNPYLTVEAPTIVPSCLVSFCPPSPLQSFVCLSGSDSYSYVAMEILTQVLCVQKGPSGKKTRQQRKLYYKLQ